MARPGRPPMKKPPLPTSVEKFLEMLTAERGAAKNTVAAYKRDLADFCEFLKTNNSTIETATTADIKAYIKDLGTRDSADKKGSTSSRTVNRRLSAMRQFYRFLNTENVRQDDPTSGIESPKQTRTLPKVLTEGEVDTLIKSCTEMSNGPDGIRLACLLELIYATGVRVSELVSLTLDAIQDNGNYLVVTGKGGRERIVPLSQPAKEALNGYLEVRNSFIAPHRKTRQAKWLFPSRTSELGHLTRQRFAQLLKDLAEFSGVDADRVSPHILRHAFATHLLNHGADLRSVQKMLGHADIATTQIYTQILDEQAKKEVSDKHPLSTGTTK